VVRRWSSVEFTNAVIDIELVYDAVDVFFNRFLFGFKLQALFLNIIIKLCNLAINTVIVAL